MELKKIMVDVCRGMNGKTSCRMFERNHSLRQDSLGRMLLLVIQSNLATEELWVCCL